MNSVDFDSIITLSLITIICAMSFLIVISLFLMHVPTGDIMEHSGLIIDVDYSQGGHVTPSATYITWNDGNVTKLYGTNHPIRQQVNATLTYQNGEYYDFFKGIEYYE